MNSEQEKDNLKARFDRLNQAVVDATLERAVFLKENLQAMGYYAQGEDIYDLDTCAKIGTVTNTYIPGFNANSSDDNSLSLNLNYQYRTRSDSNFIDNTSRRHISHGNKEDVKQRLEINKRIAERKLKEFSNG